MGIVLSGCNFHVDKGVKGYILSIKADNCLQNKTGVAMIFKNAVLSVFSNKTAIKLLAALCGAQGLHSGRALARMAGINHQSCSSELKKLAALGVIKRDGSGRTAVYALNRSNINVRDIIEPVFKAEENLKIELAHDLAGLAKADTVSIILFGSVAKGKDSAESDIDIMMVVRDADKKEAAADRISKASGFFIAKYGNVLSPAILSVPEFRGAYKKKNGLVMEIFRSGTVIYGKNMGELIK